MEETTNMSAVVDEIKNADEESMGKIQKHLDKPGKASLRDYERCIADIKKILAVQLTEQNDSEEIAEGDET